MADVIPLENPDSDFDALQVLHHAINLKPIRTLVVIEVEDGVRPGVYWSGDLSKAEALWMLEQAKKLLLEG